ncbi:hypothetical protein KDW07_12140 [Burkholderia dolosa]|nr:hypothetical protein [Burkholderia dolosa]MBY4831135.1 hypothetical protein [Burkholderia dolosa]
MPLAEPAQAVASHRDVTLHRHPSGNDMTQTTQHKGAGTADPRDAAGTAAESKTKDRRREPASPPGHAPGGGELDSIPDDQARKVVPDDPRETQARDPAGKPWPDEHDAPDDSGNRPRPL